jgi:hypothetical protein
MKGHYETLAAYRMIGRIAFITGIVMVAGNCVGGKCEYDENSGFVKIDSVHTDTILDGGYYEADFVLMNSRYDTIGTRRWPIDSMCVVERRLNYDSLIPCVVKDLRTDGGCAPEVVIFSGVAGDCIRN